MCVRERWGAGYVTRVSRDARSFLGNGESIAWRRDCEVFVVNVCSFAWFVSFPCCFVPLWRVSCSVCVIACAAGMRARNKSARESCRARSFRVKR